MCTYIVPALHFLKRKQKNGTLRCVYVFFFIDKRKRLQEKLVVFMYGNPASNPFQYLQACDPESRVPGQRLFYVTLRFCSLIPTLRAVYLKMDNVA